MTTELSNFDATPCGHESVLEARGLGKVYGEKHAVSGVNLSICRGEILGLLGPNGAGKTTIVGMLYGAVIPTKGEIRTGYGGKGAEGRDLRRKMGVVTQDDNLDPDFSVFENLYHFAHHYRITGRDAARRADLLLQQMGLREYRNYPIEKLSGGLKRRLVLARALLNNPEIIFLDEPTVGLDPTARQEFWRTIIELKEEGRAVLLTTHYMEEAERLCDRLVVLQRGSVIDEGAPGELIERIAGVEVAEVQGAPEGCIEKLAEESGAWLRQFGPGQVVGLPAARMEEVWRAMFEARPKKIVRRKANLDDVFLLLTGETLE